MGWMEQVRSSLIAGALMAVWVAQPPLVLGEVPSDNRINAGRDGTRGGTDSLSARQSGAAPILHPERNAHQPTMTPLGVPSPPHQLTPAPVLPFHPNGTSCLPRQCPRMRRWVIHTIATDGGRSSFTVMVTDKHIFPTT